MIRISRLVVLAIGLMTASAKAEPQPIAVSSERFEVDALDVGGDGAAARVMITNRETSRRHFISINSTLGRLTAAHIRDADERVVLICDNGFAVVDPRGRVPADEIYARRAVASPGGNWIAYLRFYPATHPGPTDAVALYDTRKSSESNHAAYPAPGERGWHAGWPIYPPASEWKDAAAVTPRDQAHGLSSMLMWLGDTPSPVLVFTIRNGETDTLIVADPSTDPIRVCSEPLPGAADTWRVKNITLKTVPSGDREVRVSSRALVGKAPEAAFLFARDGCAPRPVQP